MIKITNVRLLQGITIDGKKVQSDRDFGGFDVFEKFPYVYFVRRDKPGAFPVKTSALNVATSDATDDEVAEIAAARQGKPVPAPEGKPKK